MLGVYADEINAQNVNGLNIAKNLNKDLFEPHMFYLGDKKPDTENIVFHKISHNIKKRNYERLKLYIHNKFDVYYFPRLGKAEFIFGVLFNKKRRIVTTIELETMFDNKLKMFFICKCSSAVISINTMLSNNALERFGLQTHILYLGANESNIGHVMHNRLTRVACIGTLTMRKRPDLIMKLAFKFPQIEFIFVGDGPLKLELEERKNKYNISNVRFMGQVSNNKVYEVLATCDLLLIASDNEGQPKTSLEAGIMGVPTCYIRTNYKIDHVLNNITGFEVNSYEEMERVLQNLDNDFTNYEVISFNVKNECQKYLWKNIIHSYETFFEEIISQYK